MLPMFTKVQGKWRRERTRENNLGEWANSVWIWPGEDCMFGFLNFSVGSRMRISQLFIGRSHLYNMSMNFTSVVYLGVVLNSLTAILGDEIYLRSSRYL